MSEFDKEAEREKLRERFEQEENQRETTERMSELLLQGATMTNKHCSECGNPIFRANGEEFCPHCQAETNTTASEPDDPSDTTEASQTPQGQSSAQQQAKQPPGQQRDIVPQDPDANSLQAERPTKQEQHTQREQPVDPSTSQQALLSALTTHADHAAQTADPQKAQAHLAAAHDAAEILAMFDSGQSNS